MDLVFSVHKSNSYTHLQFSKSQTHYLHYKEYYWTYYRVSRHICHSGCYSRIAAKTWTV